MFAEVAAARSAVVSEMMMLGDTLTWTDMPSDSVFLFIANHATVRLPVNITSESRSEIPEKIRERVETAFRDFEEDRVLKMRGMECSFPKNILKWIWSESRPSGTRPYGNSQLHNMQLAARFIMKKAL